MYREAPTDKPLPNSGSFCLGQAFPEIHRGFWCLVSFAYFVVGVSGFVRVFSFKKQAKDMKAIHNFKEAFW